MKKVIVGISGGVDSSVAAAILKQQGYEVIGVTFIFTDDFDTHDAIEVCKKLEIEHHIIDYRKIFKSTIIDNFINDYNNGITPNPCILCNREVKFNFLYQNMLKYNCDRIATGHYAKIIDNKLYKSEDLNKDQTYFLAQLSREQLSKIILPLEGLDKDEVRKIAKEFGLITADKKDSTDICFISNNFKEYISSTTKNNEGDVINIANNEIIGKHNGLSKYTIGQRRGLNIGGTQDRMFVVGKDVNKNILYIALGDNNEYLYSDSCLIENLNWISDKIYNKCTAKFRYHQNDNDVDVEFIDDKHALVKYPQKVKSATPGQACVFYKDEECLGGGIIKEVYNDNKKMWYL